MGAVALVDVALGAVASGPAPSPPGAVGPRGLELFFEVKARTQSPAVSASVTASARLRMAAREGSSGRRDLVLVEPLSPAWKLYAVDPAGPFGEEVKLAAEATLDEPSWGALARARSQVDGLAAEEYRRMKAENPRLAAFDGAFVFVILGPPESRFRLRLGAAGEVAGVENGLTDRWLPGDFGGHVAAWTDALAAGRRPPLGYWFWNRGEKAPPAWEPHVYHALEVALRLLATPLPRPEEGAAGETVVPYRGVGESARAVLATLAPKARLSFRAAGEVPVRFTTRALGEGRWEIVGRGQDRRGEVALERRAEWRGATAGFVRDEVGVRLDQDGGWLEIAIGLRPLAGERAEG